MFPSTSKFPVTRASPVTVNKLPSNVKLALSCSNPPVPASTTLSAVKFVFVILVNETSAASRLPPTVKEPSVISNSIVWAVAGLGPTLNIVPSYVKFESPSNSPLVPATTISLFVKSSTLALAKVA